MTGGYFLFWMFVVVVVVFVICLFYNKLHTYGTSSGRVVCLQSITAWLQWRELMSGPWRNSGSVICHLSYMTLFLFCFLMGVLIFMNKGKPHTSAHSSICAKNSRSPGHVQCKTPFGQKFIEKWTKENVDISWWEKKINKSKCDIILTNVLFFFFLSLPRCKNDCAI